MKNIDDCKKKNGELYDLLSVGIVTNTKLLVPMPYQNMDHPGLKDFLQTFYEGEQGRHKLTASLINAIFTTETTIFVLTQRLYFKLIKEDPNHTLTSLNTKTFKEMLTNLCERGIIERLRAPEFGVAGLYRLAHPHLLDLFQQINPDIDIETVEEEAISRYDRITSSKTKVAGKKKKDE